jgi:lysophospholipase L1-like esterase
MFSAQKLKMKKPLIFFLIVFILIFAGEWWIRKYKDPLLCYIPVRKFWDLEKITNLFGQYDGKDELILYHMSSCHYTEDIVRVRKLQDTRRIMVIGTSSAEGYALPKEYNFVSLLQNKLNEYDKDEKFEVINAARGGHTSYQLLVYFEEVLLRLSPDIVVLYLGSNDCIYSGFITDKKYYEKVKKVAEDIKDDAVKIKRLFQYGPEGFNPIYRLLAESRLFGYVYFKFFDPTTGANRIRRYVQRVPPHDQEYVLRRLASLSKKHNFKLIFMPEIVNRNVFRDSPNQSLYYYNLMKKIAEKENLIFVDLEPLFRRYADEKVLLDNVHPTPLGHSLIAEKLYEVFIDTKLN